jgi:hypothetical protein
VCVCDWGFEPMLQICKAEALLLEPHLQSILLWLFWRCVLGTICPGWPWTVILPISASQVAMITGMSHQHLAHPVFLSQGLCQCCSFHQECIPNPHILASCPSIKSVPPPQRSLPNSCQEKRNLTWVLEWKISTHVGTLIDLRVLMSEICKSITTESRGDGVTRAVTLQEAQNPGSLLDLFRGRWNQNHVVSITKALPDFLTVLTFALTV